MHTIFQKLTAFFFLCSFFSFSPKFQQGFCEGSRSEWIRKKELLDKVTIHLASGHKLNKNDLKRVIYPEFMTFDADLNTLEEGLVKFLFNTGVEKYKRISLGPFQMQLQFISTILENTEDLHLHDPILIKARKEGYPFMISNISHLTEIKTQWKILLLFEQYCLRKGILLDNSHMDGMINFYNTGKTSNNQIVFSKIKCDKKSYLEWSTFFNNL